MKLTAIHTFLFIVITCFNVVSCTSIISKVRSTAHSNTDSNLYATLEKELFMSCPIYKGPDSVVVFLEGKVEFIRNKDYDYGNGSVRFNAKNAVYEGLPLVDDKSLFLLNYNITGDHDFYLFQAIYHFKTESDKSVIYNRMIEFLDKELQLLKEIKYDIEKTPYLRYHLPDGGGFNFKHSAMGKEKHFIDIIWVPDVKK